MCNAYVRPVLEYPFQARPLNGFKTIWLHIECVLSYFTKRKQLYWIQVRPYSRIINNFTELILMAF